MRRRTSIKGQWQIVLRGFVGEGGGRLFKEKVYYSVNEFLGDVLG